MFFILFAILMLVITFVSAMTVWGDVSPFEGIGLLMTCLVLVQVLFVGLQCYLEFGIV